MKTSKNFDVASDSLGRAVVDAIKACENDDDVKVLNAGLLAAMTMFLDFYCDGEHHSEAIDDFAKRLKMASAYIALKGGIGDV